MTDFHVIKGECGRSCNWYTFNRAQHAEDLVKDNQNHSLSSPRVNPS